MIPADGFYEWAARPDGTKQPWFVTRADGEPMVFAGVWERWGEGAEKIDSFAILTSAAGPDVAHLHHRCPVIVPPGRRGDWLDPASDPQTFFQPLEEGVLQARAVSTRVNKVREDDAGLIEAVSDA